MISGIQWNTYYSLRYNCVLNIIFEKTDIKIGIVTIKYQNTVISTLHQQKKKLHLGAPCTPCESGGLGL